MPIGFGSSNQHHQEGKLKLTLTFENDLTEYNRRLVLNMENRPSWVLEIVGLTETDRNTLSTTYDRLRKPPNEDWVPGITPIFDIHDWDITEFHDMTSLFNCLTELGYKGSGKNLPPNTTGFQPKESREWNFSKH